MPFKLKHKELTRNSQETTEALISFLVFHKKEKGKHRNLLLETKIWLKLCKLNGTDEYNKLQPKKKLWGSNK